MPTKFIKRIKFNPSELAQIRRTSSDYIWVAIDINKGVIAAGDQFLVDLRDALLYKHSRPRDIYGLGLDLHTGEIYYAPVINRMNENYREYWDIPKFKKDRIETLISYFFEDFAPFKQQSYLPRYAKPRALASTC